MSPQESHQHSLITLNYLSMLDDYMSNITNVCDMGAGTGLDACYLATMSDSNGRDFKFNVTAVEHNPGMLLTRGRMNWVFDDVHTVNLPQQDMIWCHDTLQYLRSPIDALMHWHSLLNVDGILIIEIPIINHINLHLDHQTVNTVIHSGVYHNYTMSNLIIQLASAGFDCRGGHFQLDKQTGWMRAAVYKTNAEPTLYKSWYDLAETNRLPYCLDDILRGKDYFSESDLALEWIDRTQSFLSL